MQALPSSRGRVAAVHYNSQLKRLSNWISNGASTGYKPVPHLRSGLLVLGTLLLGGCDSPTKKGGSVNTAPEHGNAKVVVVNLVANDEPPCEEKVQLAATGSAKRPRQTMNCGWGIGRTQIEWRHLRTAGRNDTYEFVITVSAPVNNPEAPEGAEKHVTMRREIKYAGKPVTVFEDKRSRIVMLPGDMNAEAAARP